MNIINTQRKSQDRLPTLSPTLRKDKSMNMTDPNGTFYQIPMSRKTSTNLSVKPK